MGVALYDDIYLTARQLNPSFKVVVSRGQVVDDARPTVNVPQSVALYVQSTPCFKLSVTLISHQQVLPYHRP